MDVTNTRITVNAQNIKSTYKIEVQVTRAHKNSKANKLLIIIKKRVKETHYKIIYNDYSPQKKIAVIRIKKL
jgi:hypothetical protein